MEKEELIRLVTAAHNRTMHIGAADSAVQLYEDAARSAEAVLGETLGGAVAGVLAIAAEERRATGLRGSLGEPRTMLSLALAVLEAEQ